MVKHHYHSLVMKTLLHTRKKLDYIETDKVYTVEICHYLYSNTVGIGVLDIARVEIRTALPYQHRR